MAYANLLVLRSSRRLRLEAHAAGFPFSRCPWLAGFALAAVLAVAPASAAPISVPFIAAPGDFVTLRVEHRHQDFLEGRALPTIVTRYSLRMTVEAADHRGAMVTVINEGTDLTVGGERVRTPPDLDSLLLLAINDLPARIELGPAGAPLRVADWTELRIRVIERARRQAAGNATLARAVELYLPGLDDKGAIYLMARPLAISAPGRGVTFNPPGATIVTKENVALPSFLPLAASAWAFVLTDDPPDPEKISVQWYGVPEPKSLREVLEPFIDQLRQLIPDAGPEIAETLQSAVVRQNYRATYGRADGRLIDFEGSISVVAGQIDRRVTITARSG